MSLPIRTQTAINEIYRNAIIEFCKEAGEAVSNVQLADGVLGGALEGEVMGFIQEPFFSAIYQLADSGRLIGFHDAETGHARYLLAENATDAQIDAHRAQFAEQTGGRAFDPNNPSEWRTPTEEVLEQQRQMQETVASLVQSLANDETVH